MIKSQQKVEAKLDTITKELSESVTTLDHYKNLSRNLIGLNKDALPLGELFLGRPHSTMFGLVLLVGTSDLLTRIEKYIERDSPVLYEQIVAWCEKTERECGR